MSADYLILTTPIAPMNLTTLIEIVHTMGVPLKTAHRVLLTEVYFPILKSTSVNKTLLFNQFIIFTCYTFIRQYKAHEQAVLKGVSIT
jgi:chromosome partitioning protein